MYTALQLIKSQIKSSREIFEGTAADVLDKDVHKDPGGKALPIGSVYAHLFFSEDAIVQGMMQGKTPLYKSSWKDKTGTDQPMPKMDAEWSVNNEKWARSVKIDLPELRKYGQAVYAATDQYVASLKDEDLEKELDLGAWGKKTIADMLLGFLVGHTFSLAGEISALKGIQGAKGYPF